MGDLIRVNERNLHLLSGSRVHLSHPAAGVIVGYGVVELDRGDPSLLMKLLQKYSLEEHQVHTRDGERIISIRWLTVHEKYPGFPYPYSFCGIEVPDQISDNLVNRIYA